MITRFIFEEEGQTLVEYALLISLLALVAVTTITIFGTRIRDRLYGDIGSQLDK